jgi:hypothetical protein
MAGPPQARERETTLASAEFHLQCGGFLHPKCGHKLSRCVIQAQFRAIKKAVNAEGIT